MSDDAEMLRNRMVDALVASGNIATDAVAAAMRAVPRHLFVPEAPLETAYADVAIPTKLHDGRAISSASQPAIVAVMLEQLALQRGDRVLEIGAGTGYNAALMARLVGPSGRVRALDIDDDIVAGARAHLASAGVDGVEVVSGDGMLGDADGAPFDRMMATVGIWDIPPPWWEQLALGGRVVMPLSLRGPQVSVAFDKTDRAVMESASVQPCGFMRLRGPLGHAETVVRAGELTIATEADLDAAAIAAAMAGDATVETIGVEASADDVFGSLALWLAVHMDGYCTTNAAWRDERPPLRFAAVVPSAANTAGWSPAVWDGASLSVVGRDGDGLVVTSFGTVSQTNHVAAVVRRWHESGRPAPLEMRLRVDRSPATAPDDADVIMTKLWTTVSARWRA